MLAAAAVPLAAPGIELVPGAAESAPGWLLGIYGDGLGVGGGAYLAALIVALLAYVGVFVAAPALDGRLVWGAILVGVAAFALAPPLLSLDVFSYIAYARLGAEHGLNPYDAVPADLAGDPAASRVEDFRFAVSVYGPLFTLGTYPLGLVGVPVALWTLKAVSAAAVVALAAVTAWLGKVRGVDPLRCAAFVALNPLVLVHVVGGPHNDGLMALAVVGGVAAIVAGLDAAGGVAIVFGAAVKASGAIVAPFAFLGAARRGRLLIGAAVAALAAGVITLAVFGFEAFEALGELGENQETISDYGVPASLARWTGIDPDVVRVGLGVAFAAALAWLIVWVARGGDWVRGAAWATAGLLVASAWLVPWYVIWALPLAAVARDRALVALVLALCALQLPSAIP